MAWDLEPAPGLPGNQQSPSTAAERKGSSTTEVGTETWSTELPMLGKMRHLTRTSEDMATESEHICWITTKLLRDINFTIAIFRSWALGLAQKLRGNISFDSRHDIYLGYGIFDRHALMLIRPWSCRHSGFQLSTHEAAHVGTSSSVLQFSRSSRNTWRPLMRCRQGLLPEEFRWPQDDTKGVSVLWLLGSAISILDMLLLICHG